MEVKDIILDDNGLTFKNGDFDVDYSDNMHIEHIMKASKGNYYQHPLLGVNILNMIKAPSNAIHIKQEIRSQLESDDMEVDQLDISVKSDDFNMEINAKRK